MTAKTRGQLRQQSLWVEKDDKWLAEVLRGDDPEDVDLAMRILQKRHQSRLERLFRGKLPDHLIDDALQDIWVGFYQQARLKPIENVFAYLRGIAVNIRARDIANAIEERHGRRARARLGNDNEDEIGAWGVTKSIEGLLEEGEERVIEEHNRDLLKQLPFIDAELSNSQRMLWILWGIYDYPSKIVARLLDSTVNTVYVQTYKARNKVLKYFQSEMFRAAALNETLPRVWEPRPRREGAVVVERFAESITPQFTPDELEPLGLSLEELQAQYVASLMLPRWHVKEDLEIGGLSMLLTRRLDWEPAQEHYRRLTQGEENVEGFIPEECLLNVDIEDGHIQLSVQPIVELVPEKSNQLLSPDNTYLSIHASRKVIPVTWGFFDHSLYTPELLERWPFVAPYMGL